MGDFRLVLLDGRQGVEEWPLALGRPIVVGRYDQARGAPDVDLSPDRSVSRRHLRLWFENDSWWLEDLDSLQGTYVGALEVRGAPAVQVEAGQELLVGQTRLALFPPGWHRLRHRQLAIEIGLRSAAGYLLARSGRPLLSRLAFSNLGELRTEPTPIEISFGTVAHGTLVAPVLEPGERRQVDLPAFRFDYRSLEGQTERQWQPLALRVDGEAVPTPAVGCWLLAYNEWSAAPDHWNTLAAFVLPNHPLVIQLLAEAGSAIDPATDPECALQLLYEHLLESWRIAYRYEPPHYASASQKVRFPHDVLSAPSVRAGQGTCLDLALLLAAGLEALHLQPLLAVVDTPSVRHALVGCWRDPGPRLEPVLNDAATLLGQAVWVDPNGCTRDPQQRKDFAAARRAAEDFLREQALLFALDVGAARFDGVTPLPFAGEPQWGDDAARAIAAARAAAEKAGTQLAMVPLLVGLLASDDPALRQLFAEVVPDARAAAESLAVALSPSPSSTAASRHYDAALAAAKARAKEAGSPLAHAVHLAAALLDVQSAALDDALRWLGTDRAVLGALLRRRGALAPGNEPDPSAFRIVDPRQG